MKTKTLLVAATLACAVGVAQAQINTGSNGSDGALNYSSITYSTNIVINMADHPTGIYQYTYVNIPQNVTVSFIPNANNTPVYWLVQSNAVINGEVYVSGQSATTGEGGQGGPGGYQGGNGGVAASGGQGPGGGSTGYYGANASYGILGGTNSAVPSSGAIYGDAFLIPFLGGSGGGGGTDAAYGGGGGGGAILIATSGNITINGSIEANGGSTVYNPYWNLYYSGGGGSGGAIRLVASSIIGTGSISTQGGVGENNTSSGGSGRVRFDTPDNNFGGSVVGAFTQGFQPIIIPTSGQGTQLLISSIGGVSVSPTPSGQVITPDAVLSAQQNDPIPVVVTCANLPLGSLITVTIKPTNGTSVSATGYNNTGTLASSTATISINIPRGGGLVYATATTAN